jgi:hypothetical protein
LSASRDDSPRDGPDCELAAHAAVRLSLDALPELRKQPGRVPGEALPPAFLKHADDQTVAGLVAVFRAIEQHSPQRLTDGTFREWGAVAGPRFLGRQAMAGALQRFLAEGAWGVSPHMIPHRSLHSISGTVSQALKAHGPNFGAGGGPGGEAEVLLAAVTLLHGKRLPGVWVVLTRLDPELPPAPAGGPAPGSFCEGLALALVSARSGGGGSRLRLKVEPTPHRTATGRPQGPPFDLGALRALLERLTAGERELTQSLGCGARVELFNHAGRRPADAGPVLLPAPCLAPFGRRRSA